MGSLTKATTETFGPGGVNSTNIQNDSITNAKIASDAAIANSKLAITFPTISSLSITNGQPAVYDTETVDINGTDFTNGARVDFIHSTTNAVLNLPTVTFVSATQLRVTVPASTLTEGTDYKIRVSNPDGLAATSTGTVLYSETVSFSTSSGSLGSVGEGESASFSVSASSNSTIAYSVTSGSLPSGLSLNSSTGAITGTAGSVSADTTSTFTITATDAESQTASRSFSITVTNFVIANSLRFNDDDSARLSRTPSSSTNRKTWTWSSWIKLNPLATNYPPIFGADTSVPDTHIRINTTNNVNISLASGQAGGGSLTTSRVLRDASAWYHILVVIDTTDATADDRMKVYINGVEETSFSSRTNPALNYDTKVNHTVIHQIGAQRYSSYWDGYMAEVHFIDGQTLSPTDFGETDSTTNNWIPKKYTGTYGTNGFYLDFADSGNLGDDESGNTNDFTATNLAATDQTTDTPTNNFATMSPLHSDRQQGGAVTFSEGNLQVATTYVDANYQRYPQAYSSQTVSSGKWYVEMKPISGNAFNFGVFSPEDYPSDSTTNPYGGYATTSCIYSYRTDITDGRVRQNGTITSPFPSFGTSDVIGCALDMDNFKVYFHKNGTYINSGDPTSGATGTGAFTLATTGSNGANITLYGFTCGDDTPALNGTMSMNFGNPSFSISSGNSDENGYGNFEYEPPSGYLALCTNNLPNVDIADPTEHFNTVLYTGDGNASGARNITGVGFQPDWTWIKERNNVAYHNLFDSNRGAGYVLSSNVTDAENNYTTYFTSFDSDGFTLENNPGSLNGSGDTYVAWNWLANGGTTSSNTDGDITSTVQANTTAGFSIVTYTGTGANATVGHGLGKVPAMIIVKNRSGAYNWAVYHQGNTSAPETDYLYLNSTQATADNSVFWNDTAPTSSVFTVGTNGGVNENTDNLVAYCFAEIEGYSKFGSYTGNGSSDGTFIYTGFRPAWLMTKRTDSTSDWNMYDNKRNTFNKVDKVLQAEGSDAEYTSGSGVILDYLSNGFKVRGTGSGINASGGTYIYMAFAEAPFKSGTGATTIEGTAR